MQIPNDTAKTADAVPDWNGWTYTHRQSRNREEHIKMYRFGVVDLDDVHTLSAMMARRERTTATHYLPGRT